MHCIPVGALSREQWTRWVELHDRMSPEVGPLLHPAYVRAVGSVRRGVEVGIIAEGDEIVGFFPYQRSAMDVARPVGDRLCDQSGVVVRPDARWSPAVFARAAGLRAIRLTNTVTIDASLRPYQAGGIASSVIDLEDGYDVYAEGRRSGLMREMGQKTRKAEREVGSVRFEWHSASDDVFARLVEWKAAQRRATRSPDVLDLPWVREVVQVLLPSGDASFGGVVSALYYGDALAAVQFSIRSRYVLHYWITAYDPALARYSPGTLLLLTVARVASEEHGIRRVELGVGDQPFKTRARTGVSALANTTVTSFAPLRTVFRAADGLRSWSHDSPVGQAVRVTRRAVKRGVYKARSLLG